MRRQSITLFEEAVALGVPLAYPDSRSGPGWRRRFSRGVRQDIGPWRVDSPTRGGPPGFPIGQARIGDTTVPPRKKAAPPAVEGNVAPNKRKPHATNGKGIESAMAKWNAAGRPLGQNAARKLSQQQYTSGPDMPPGRPLTWLPTPEEVPPKPTGPPPDLPWPGPPYPRSGHTEWQLRTYFLPDAKELFLAKEPHVDYRQWEPRFVPPDERRCQARSIAKIGDWQGNRCSMTAIRGGRVCPTHGGNLENVKKAAQRALARAALPAAEKLIHIAITKKGVTDTDRLRAIIEILNRAGVEGKHTIELEIKPWQDVLQRVYASETGGASVTSEETEGEDFYLEDEEAAPDVED